MSDSNSIICFIRCNYRLASVVLCVIYLVVSFICVVKFALNVHNGSFQIFFCKFLARGFEASIGICITSVMALLGLVLNSPFLIVPLILMNFVVFAMIKLSFCDLLMEAIHGPGASMLWTIFLCISFVTVSRSVLWLLYCSIIQISLIRWPDSPIRCRIRRRDISPTTSTTQRNRRAVVVIL